LFFIFEFLELFFILYYEYLPEKTGALLLYKTPIIVNGAIVIDGISFLKLMLHQFYDAIILKHGNGCFLYAAATPSILFYVFVVGMMLAKLLHLMEPAIRWFIKRLEFRQPFKAVFILSGALLAGLWILVDAIVKMTTS
jgi:hypothetical protein